MTTATTTDSTNTPAEQPSSEVTDETKTVEAKTTPVVSTPAAPSDEDTAKVDDELGWEGKYRQQKKYSNSWEQKYITASKELETLKAEKQTNEFKQQVIREKLSEVKTNVDFGPLLTATTLEGLQAQADSILAFAGLTPKETPAPTEVKAPAAQQIVINPFQETQPKTEPKLGFGEAIVSQLNK